MDWSNILQKVLEVSIDILLPAILLLIAAALNEWRQKMKTGKYAEQYILIERVITDAVKAAETAGINGAIQNIGADKLDYAARCAERELLEHYNIKLDLKALLDRIEAKHWDEFGWEKRHDKAMALVSSLGGDSLGKGAA